MPTIKARRSGVDLRNVMAVTPPQTNTATIKSEVAALKRIERTKRALGIGVERTSRDGTVVSLDACYNLMGALHDIADTGRVDKVTIRTLRRVEKQLSDAKKVLTA